MIRNGFLAGLLALSAVIPARAGGDPAAVAAVERFLRDDEKAMLAAVLTNRAAATEFNDDVKLAGTDTRIMKLVLDKWRGRIVAFAETDVRIATPNLEGTYRNSSALMTPQTRAYLLRRLKTMEEDDRNSLIDYLSSVDSALASNGGKLTWYTKKVVSGIFDKYRKDLSTYLPEPLARDGKAAAPAAALALAELRRVPEPVAVVTPPPVRRDPIVTPPARSTPTVEGSTPTVRDEPSVVISTSTSALEQARRAAEAAERGGVVFDGGGATPPETEGVVAGDNKPGAPHLEPSSRPAGTPTLIADVPSPVDPDEDFMSRIKKMKTGSGPMQPRHYLPKLLGAILGAVLGFFLGGPIGAVVGAAAGFGAGHFIGAKLFQ